MSDTFRVACLQMQTGNDLAVNLEQVKQLAREAAAQRAQFVLTPEYTLMMDGSGRVMRERALPSDGGAPLRELQSLAQELSLWLLVGSLTLRTETEWVETVEVGWNVLVGCDTGRIVRAVQSFSPPGEHPALYGDGQSAARCVELLG